MSTRDIIDSRCGLYCAECQLREPYRCGGCIATDGSPFHGRCSVADCVRSRAISFCGECADFPCDRLRSYSYDKEHGDNGARIERCRQLKAALVSEARSGTDPISRCGHHCDHCFLGQWCGGCRSSYNCCSFATICDGSVCPNVQCSEQKGLDGCYECDCLNECTKGYFGCENEHAAKATAIFISRHGKDAYSATLEKFIADGRAYTKSLDECGSPNAAAALLEKYYV